MCVAVVPHTLYVREAAHSLLQDSTVVGCTWAQACVRALCTTDHEQPTVVRPQVGRGGGGFFGGGAGDGWGAGRLPSAERLRPRDDDTAAAGGMLGRRREGRGAPGVENQSPPMMPARRPGLPSIHAPSSSYRVLSGHRRQQQPSLQPANTHVVRAQHYA
jgi:hypothetical protein